MIALDPPEHTRVRKAVLSEFSAHRTRAMRPRVQRIVDEFVDTMLEGPNPADLVQAIALPVPSLVISELLGVPYEDHEFFQLRSSRFLQRNTPMPERQAAVDEIQQYMSDLIDAKSVNPSDDFIGRQISKQQMGGSTDRQDLIATCFLLLVAGHETTVSMIGLGVLMLLRDDGLRDSLVNDPSKTPRIVEELLRYFTIAEVGSVRVAKEDVEIGGVLIRSGEGVIGLTSVANRDPLVYSHADEIDIERGAQRHLAFGFGPHQCIGQSLARMELQIVFDTLFRRVPTLQLAAELNDLPFRNNGASVYGVDELPVSW